MKLSKNFSLEELIKSDTANECGIKNSPNSLELKNLTNLTTKILQPIRDAFGKPIIISSGFRCVQLNKKVGGASNSDHLFGAAADIHTSSNTYEDNKKLYDAIISLKNKGKISCRQIIWEYGKKNVGPKWIHISVNHTKNSYKKNQLVYVGI